MYAVRVRVRPVVGTYDECGASPDQPHLWGKSRQAFQDKQGEQDEQGKSCRACAQA